MTSPLANGEPLTRSTCYRCGADGPTVPRPCKARECRSPVCIDLCVECVGQYNSYNRPPTGRTFPEFWPNTHTATWESISRTALQQMIEQTAVPFPDMYSPDEAEAGAQLTPEVLEAVRQRVISTPLRQDSVASRILGRREPVLRQRYQWSDGDTQFVLDDTRDDDRIYFAPGLPMRPDHYRVHPGRCICGFQSSFARDMADHLAQREVSAPDGYLKTWRVCECGESRLCRRVAVASNPSITFSIEPLDSAGPTVDTIYLCDLCCQRRGIGR